MHSSHCFAIPGHESLRSPLFFTAPVPCPNALCGITGWVIYGSLSQEQQVPIKGGATLYSSELQWCLKWARAVWRSPPNIHLVDMSLGGIPLAAGTQLWEELTSVSACPFCGAPKASGGICFTVLLRSAFACSWKACCVWASSFCLCTAVVKYFDFRLASCVKDMVWVCVFVNEYIN